MNKFGGVMEFLKVLGGPIARSFDYRGRLTRGEFFAWWLLTMIVGLVSYWAIMGVFMGGHWPSWLWSYEIYIAWAPGLLLCIPTWAAMSRRLRDAGISPNWLWINAIPLALFALNFVPVVAFLGLQTYYLLLQGNLVISIVVFIANLVMLARPTAKQ
jgi:uncharacterized membrane protein YhaH (DUF805 family)